MARSLIVVVGGGAAGFFAALSAREHGPGTEVLILEKSNKLLAKVRVSGGGRCNVTHDRPEVKRLAQHYPRGERFLRKAFAHWGVKETIAWFAQRGVRLKTEVDGRMFPVTDSSQTIIDCLQGAASDAGVVVRQGLAVNGLKRDKERFSLSLSDGSTLLADRVIVAAGGHPKSDAYGWLLATGHSIVPPVPSLFTFNLKHPMPDLMGVVAPRAIARIEGADIEAGGPVLITHWGLSGPAVLRLSAWGARALHAKGYRYAVRVNWIGVKEQEARDRLNEVAESHPKRQLVNAAPFDLPQRLWAYLLDRAATDPMRPMGEVRKRDRDRLIDLLVNDRYEAEGKTTFKEEFVTAGGVALEEVDPNTLQSRLVPGLFFAGEVLDIDGITGGFNFQAAWTTGWIAGRSAAGK